MKILVVIDPQNDFIDGVLPCYNAKEAMEHLNVRLNNVLAEINNESSTHVYVTQDCHSDDYLDTYEGKNLPVYHCLLYSHGWDLHPYIKDFLIKMGTKSLDGSKYLVESFWKSNFDCIQMVRSIQGLTSTYEIEEVEVCGFALDICVLTNLVLLKTYLPKNIPLYVNMKCSAATTKEAYDAAALLLDKLQIKKRGV